MDGWVCRIFIQETATLSHHWRWWPDRSACHQVQAEMQAIQVVHGECGLWLTKVLPPSWTITFSTRGGEWAFLRLCQICARNMSSVWECKIWESVWLQVKDSKILEKDLTGSRTVLNLGNGYGCVRFGKRMLHGQRLSYLGRWRWWCDLVKDYAECGERTCLGQGLCMLQSQGL